MYDTAIGRLAASGADVLVVTAYHPGYSPIFGALRGRFVIYNELVREIAECHGATVVDFWRLRDCRDDRRWDTDRLHMSSAGHQRMAIAVLDTLGVEHELAIHDLGERVELSARQRRTANLEWATSHAAPWVRRRLTGTSSGDHVNARRPSLAPVEP